MFVFLFFFLVCFFYSVGPIHSRPRPHDDSFPIRGRGRQIGNMQQQNTGFDSSNDSVGIGRRQGSTGNVYIRGNRGRGVRGGMERSERNQMGQIQEKFMHVPSLKL